MKFNAKSESEKIAKLTINTFAKENRFTESKDQLRKKDLYTCYKQYGLILAKGIYNIGPNTSTEPSIEALLQHFYYTIGSQIFNKFSNIDRQNLDKLFNIVTPYVIKVVVLMETVNDQPLEAIKDMMTKSIDRICNEFSYE